MPSVTLNATPSPTGHRHQRRNLRYSTAIIPSTGERVRRQLSFGALGDNGSSTPLGEDGNGGLSPFISRRQQRPTLRSRVSLRMHQSYEALVGFLQSNTGQGVIKCSLAYLLGSLATFLPPISAWLGHQDGKHIVATITVYFHPARSIGSMHEATVLAFIAFLYAMFISFTSMGISIFFGQRDMLVTGHAIVLIFFCGGGLGFIAWLKQRLGNPLVNVACSLASLATITTLTVEGSVQAAKFSEDKVVQVLQMVFLGITATTLVNLLIKPVSARKELCKDFTKSTDLLGDLLVAVTRAFLSGSELDMQASLFEQVSKDHRACMGKMKKDLKEGKWEHYFVGTAKEYKIEARLVKCLQRLSQSLGGLRSAATTQFDLIRTSKLQQARNVSAGFSLERAPSFITPMSYVSEPEELPSAILDPIDEEAEETDSNANTAGTPQRTGSPAIGFGNSRQPQTPADMFTTFISQLGPPMRSLVYTLKQILDELPYEEGSNNKIAVNQNFRTSLISAIELYKNARRESLSALYKNKDLYRHNTLERVADIEEVAASCGHFSFGLVDFAEDTYLYLDILQDLKAETEHSPRSRSWEWLKFWNRRRISLDNEDSGEALLHEHDEDQGQSYKVPEPFNRKNTFVDPEKPIEKRPWTYQLYRTLKFLRRDDIRFAAKVGIGAALFALPAFIPSTRPTFSHFRGQWGLVSYMVVCSMTIGASNTTGLERFLGTGLGALCAIIAWILADESPWLLAFFGWLVSLGCFYLIVAQGRGPMGRFILLTYNLSALYAYSLSAKDDDDDDDEGGINPEIWEIVLHRVVSVIAGCIWAILVTRVLWPISARKKLKDGICVLWLRMGLIWKRDPLTMLLAGEPQSSVMDIREEAELQSFFSYLQTLRKAAQSEFELRGPFPDKTIGRILERTGRMLDNFHAMNVEISKDLKASPGEAEVLRYTRSERAALSARISHLFSVLASSVKMEYPLNDVLPNVENSRDRLLARIFEFRRNAQASSVATDADYELIYCYALVTGQLASDISAVGRELEELYGTLNEDDLKLE